MNTHDTPTSTNLAPTIRNDRDGDQPIVADRLRIALLAYRGNPHCGGQGVYTRHLARSLVELGHRVTVFAGQPYPELDEGVELVRLASLDLYRAGDPFRIPRLREISGLLDVLEIALMCTGGFPEPMTFSLRSRAALRRRIGEFDIVHDNQSLGFGLLAMRADRWPVVASIHHPVTIDRAADLAIASTSTKRLSVRRWYGFARMQALVARRLTRIITVSQSSKADIVREVKLASDVIDVVPVGVDPAIYRPFPEVARIPGRLMTTASADVALKGLAVLLEALAKLRTERPDAHLIVIGRLRPSSPAAMTIERLGLKDVVKFVTDASDEDIARHYAEAQLAVVPSLYEGFSLPAIEAMACGVPVIATTGGALPEVVGSDGVTALLVTPGDSGALTLAIDRLLSDEQLAMRLGNAGRTRVLERYTWGETARRTVACYRSVIAQHAKC